MSCSCLPPGPHELIIAPCKALASAFAHTSACALCAHFVSCSASSQIFFLLKESELTPSGANLLDGRYAVFGYAVQGQDSLGVMKVRSLLALLNNRSMAVLC